MNEIILAIPGIRGVQLTWILGRYGVVAFSVGFVVAVFLLIFVLVYISDR